MTKYQFEANVQKLLHLVTHTVYQDKDQAIRELISNASDACNKLIQATNLNQVASHDDLKITVKLDAENKKIYIVDNGIGLTKIEMIDNLGCIANSGTEKFLESLKDKKNTNIIGKFGIGFYAAFLIADKVKFYSKSAIHNEGNWNVWISNGQDGYTIEEDSSVDMPHGSIIELHIKESEFLEPFKLKNIIKKYSDHIDLPIVFKDKDKEEKVNEGKALWLRPKNEITEEEYNEFAQTKFYHSDKPLSVIHNFLEGTFEYVSLFYIPFKKGLALISNRAKADVQLYINKVFIASETIEILPKFLRFVFGIVDCPSLHLNLSRENIQNNAVLKKLQTISIKKILETLIYEQKENRENYEEFFRNYGDILKEGLCDPASYGYDDSIKELLLKSCLFFSAKEQKMISLEEFNDQEKILYINTKSISEGMGNLQVERHLAANNDVLILTSHVDNFWAGNGFSFKSKTFTSVHSVAQSDKDSKEKDSQDSLICQKFKHLLHGQVANVFISKDHASAPVSLILNTVNNMSAQMEKYLVEQNHLQERSKPTLEINVNHELIKKLEENLDSPIIDAIMYTLFCEAKISAGEEVSDIKGFRKSINDVIIKSLS